jgi:hypothetical protein
MKEQATARISQAMEGLSTLIGAEAIALADIEPRAHQPEFREAAVLTAIADYLEALSVLIEQQMKGKRRA